MQPLAFALQLHGYAQTAGSVVSQTGRLVIEWVRSRQRRHLKAQAPGRSAKAASRQAQLGRCHLQQERDEGLAEEGEFRHRAISVGEAARCGRVGERAEAQSDHGYRFF